MYEKLIRSVDCLNSNDLRIIQSKLEFLDYKRSLVLDDRSQHETSGRTSLGCALDEDSEECKILHKSINSALCKYKDKIFEEFGEIFDRYPLIVGTNTKSFREQIQILKYEKGGIYDYHHDTADYPSRKYYFRTFSVVLYLNNDFEGGSTNFIHNEYKPNPGQALIFPSNWIFKHKGSKVTSGTKYVAVTWYYVQQSNCNFSYP
tara:strand:- start:443 stop:1054 length:612 start_codon:yes stop_codon:yes gene_type:complete